MAKLSVSEFTERAEAELARQWGAVISGARPSPVPVEVQQAIQRSINSGTKSYRYVLPTQVLAKVVDSSLDSRSLQAGSGFEGSFDARSLCHRVIVPFDQANHNVLGGSGSPYLNNPLRVPSLTTAQRAAQKNKVGFDDLCRVIEFLEANPGSATALLVCVLAAIRDRLGCVRIIYPVPNRVSLKQTQAVIRNFLSERTGGVRLQAVSVALFRSIGGRFRLYEQVRVAPVNAADAATGSVADLTCLDSEGQLIMAVEVKDQELRLTQLQEKLPAIREQGVRELLFVVTRGVAEPDAEAMAEAFEREFATGQNVYVASFDRFLESSLILFGEAGRRQFLVDVGQAVDDIKADLIHRQTWRNLLQTL